MRVLKVIVVIAAICSAAVVISSGLRTKPNHHHPVAAELERLRADAERLEEVVRGRIESINAVQSTLRQTIDTFGERVAGVQSQIEQTQAEFAQRSQTVRRYLTLLEKNRGAVLPDGHYIAPDVVRRQYDFEQGQVDALRLELMLLQQQRDKVERVSYRCQRRYEAGISTLIELRAAQSQLQEQLAHMELMLRAFPDEGWGESTMASDVRRLQADIAAIQDHFDVYLHESSEIFVLDLARQDTQQPSN